MSTCEKCGQPVPGRDVLEWRYGEGRFFQRPYTTPRGKGVAQVTVYLSHPTFSGDRYFTVSATVDDKSVSVGLSDPRDIAEILRAWDAALASEFGV